MSEIIFLYCTGMKYGMVFTNNVVLFNKTFVIVGTKKVPNDFERQTRVANNENFSTGVSLLPVMY